MSLNELFAIYYTVGVIITSSIAYSNTKENGKAREKLERVMSDLRVLSGSSMLVIVTVIFVAGIAALLWPYAMVSVLLKERV